MTCATGPMCQHQPDCADKDCPGRPDREREFDPEELLDSLVHRATTVGIVLVVVAFGIVVWLW